MALPLPGGRPGQALALCIPAMIAVLLWVSLAAPLLRWFDERDDRLRARETMADRMTALVETLPGLKREAEASGAATAEGTASLTGSTDAVAAAALQQRLNELAAAAGIRLASEEILPARPSGLFTIIAVRVTLNAPWEKFAAFMLALTQAEIVMTTEELLLRGTPSHMLRGPDALPDLRAEDTPVDATMVVAAFRSMRSGTR